MSGAPWDITLLAVDAAVAGTALAARAAAALPRAAHVVLAQGDALPEAPAGGRALCRRPVWRPPLSGRRWARGRGAPGGGS